MLLRYTGEEFLNSHIVTLGIDFKIKEIEINKKKIKLQIWDTAGHEKFGTISQSYYKGIKGVIIVYDCTSKESFENVVNWVK